VQPAAARRKDRQPQQRLKPLLLMLCQRYASQRQCIPRRGSRLFVLVFNFGQVASCRRALFCCSFSLAFFKPSAQIRSSQASPYLRLESRPF
jgi:hypothetical protein